MLNTEKHKAIMDFLPRLQEQVTKDFIGFGSAAKLKDEYTMSHIPVIRYEEGKRFVKIVRTDPDGHSGSCFGFIEKETGLLWKAATWRAPALNFPRGSIHDEDISKIRWTGIM